MYNLIWSRKELNTQKLGTFCEYYAKMTLTSYGMNIYTSEVDDHGIDFVAETPSGFKKFQVKSLRKGSTYTCMREEHFNIHDGSLYLFLLYLVDGEHPEMFIIPSSAWQNHDSKVFVYHSYEGKKSKPEYGVNISSKNKHLLECYKIENMLETIIH